MENETTSSTTARRRNAVWVAFAVLAALALPLAALAAGRGDTARSVPSFAREVAPLLREKCTGCHRLGGIAPFSLETAKAAKLYAPAIGAAVGARIMPPWPPSAASPRMLGQDLRTLTAAQRSTLVRWAAAGGPVDRAVAPGRAPSQGQPPRPGESVRELALEAAYTPRATGGVTDDYRCFLLDPSLDEDVFVTSTKIEPGAKAVVHHVILFKVPQQQVAQAKSLDARAPGLGWSCFGGTGLPLAGNGGGIAGALEALDDAPWLSAWAPGGTGDRIGDGLGIPLAKGSGIVMQVHYNLLNGIRPDRSRAVLTTVPASTGLKPVQTSLLIAPVELPCAKGESGPLCKREAAVSELARKYGAQAAYVPLGLLYLCGKNTVQPPTGPTTFCDRRVDRPTTLLGVAGHMHLLGTRIRIELNPGTPGRRVLLDIPRWDFHWQGMYRLVTPLQAKPGDVVRVTCTYDVTKRKQGEPGIPKTPRYVLWGEGTTDEMCLGVLRVARE